MSLLAKAKELKKSKLSEISEEEDVPVSEIFSTRSGNEITRRSISDKEFELLKKHIQLLRKKIGDIVGYQPTDDEFKAIVLWFRVTREENFIAQKVKPAKVPKEKKLTKKQKEALEIERYKQVSIESLL